MVALPTVAEADAVRVKTVLQVGRHEAGEKEAVTPEGIPEAEKFTVWVVPELKVAVMLLVMELPCVTDLAPSLPKEKSNGA